MKYWNQFKVFIKEEIHQKRISAFFTLIFLLTITANLLTAMMDYLPVDPLFFFTCDRFELFLIGLIVVVLYFKIFLKDLFLIKVFSLLVSMAILLGLAFLKAYRKERFFEEVVFDEFTSYLGIFFLILSLFFFIDNLNLFINNAYIRTKKALEEAELQLLRQQFSPHFLYNAFNSLYSMSLQNHPKTSDSILKLSGMMRYLTDDAVISGTLLKHELKFIQDYIEIEKVRFGSEADIQFKLEGELKDQLIEPLLLISLVENAFKHGFYTNNSRAYVNILAKFDEQNLNFIVKNKVLEKQHFQKSERVGKGLNQLRKRLALSYAGNANLELTNDGQEFTAELNLQLK